MQDLRVDLATFQGPLDLLLYLVQQEEVAVEEVQIARIADRFLEVCQQEVASLDVDQAGEFLVMASQLLVMKSRALLPREEEVDLEEIDPRLDLVRQLLEYRRYKGASAELEARFEVQKGKTPVRLRRPAHQPDPEEDETLELDLFALVTAFQRLLRETGGDESVHMPKERLPITHFVGTIFDELTAMGGQTNFDTLIGKRPDRTYVIGAFLALLELIKLQKVIVRQDGVGEILIEIREDAVHPHPEGEDAAHIIEDVVLEEEEHVGPRIVFMGSPAFAVPALQSLAGRGYAPRLVVTPPPRRAGRGRRLMQVPLAQEADNLQVPLHRTNDVNGRTSRDEIEAMKPDVIITAGFGQKLGSGVLDLPAHGCLNLHTSILPKYRGASPVAAAIRAGETETGVTIFRMDAEMDHGPVLATRTVPIGPDDNTEDVTAKLADAAADLLVRTLDDYLEGRLEPTEQDHEQATYVGRLTKADGIIDWDQPALAVRNQIRAVTPWPGAQTAWQPKVRHDPLPLLVLRTELLGAADPAAPEETAAEEVFAAETESPPAASEAAGGAEPEASGVEEAGTPGEAERPGTVIAVSKAGIDVACAEGVLRILSVKPSGARPMAVKDFLNARRVVRGDTFVKPKAPSARTKR